ncbi:hypothetical protein ZWY2020_044582 [Hordeum vulgare]|nr:hypothetical protein ZWY2020_044582 [Hordeum vulgare]
MAAADTATAALPDAEEKNRNPHAAAADGSLCPKQPAVFDPFPVCAEYGSRFAEDVGAANAEALHGQFGGRRRRVRRRQLQLRAGRVGEPGLRRDHEQQQQLELRRRGGQRAGRRGAALGQGGPAFADMERQHDAALEHKFSLPCQEQSLLASFEFNLERYV